MYQGPCERKGHSMEVTGAQAVMKSLEALGVDKVRLLTNNPAKIARMEEEGIAVAERVPLRVGETRFNHHYLKTKAEKSGHLL